MHEHQQDLRISADRAFRDSLDQLQNILAQESQTAPEFQPDDSHLSISETDLTVWEEAVADIDEFFGDQPPELEGLDE